jgi:DNA-binding response OmpR family regulator
VRVLVIEDEQVLANAVARGLRRQGMAVDFCFDGADALDKAAVNHYDVIVLDRDLPGVHGDEVCRRLATQGASTRILMLTAAGTVDDRVQGLDLGADDYLGKPFAFSELVARVRDWGGAAPRRPRRCWPTTTWCWTRPSTRRSVAATSCG